MKTSLTTFFLAVLTILIMAPKFPADEGLWLFNNPPKKILKEKHQFDPPESWYEHVQKASVRFNSGGSGSFVSPDGLVMTNHHVGADTLQKISTPEKDYLKNGFYAKTRDQEVKSSDLELNVLMDIEDVTDRVNAAVKEGMPPDKAFLARRAIIAKIEEESLKKTGLRSNVITLYQGGAYHLYRFKRYTDVRLVFAPEQQIAFFGGDPDNFAFPRYDLDVCFFRVYEDDQPAKIKHYLKWNDKGAGENDLVFVSGHPGRTNRANTVAELEYFRDKGYPYLLQRLNRLEVMLTVYSAYGEEHERRAKDLLFGVANSRKARVGGLAGLQDPDLWAKKIAEEKAFKNAIARVPKMGDTLQAFDTIAKVQKVRAKIIRRHILLEQGAGFNSTLFGWARTLVRAAEEYPKPNADRLQEYGEANKKSLELELFSEEPVYVDFELTKLSDSLGWFAEELGYENKLVQNVLAGKSPRDRAADIIQGTKLQDLKLREAIYKGGAKAIDSSTDPMIRLAKLVDDEARTVRKTFESEIDEPRRQAYAKLAAAKFALQGTGTYPDATFTLRLSFGTAKGYEEEGKTIPFETTIAGLYERAKDKNFRPPFDLPKRWLDRKSKLNLKTPFNFVCTTDIIGGNSGSPVINRDAEVVGLIFDGNIQSLIWDFVYTDKQARAVAVCTPAITEALRAVYDAGPLAEEIVGTRRRD
jgi:hypothetical protein